jgi:hypothetical protein
MPEVNAFWSDGPLSNLEIVCMSSFVQQGVGYNLYVYDEPPNAPKGVTLKDAEQILPRSRVYRYQAGNICSVSGFTNLFRYTIIHKLGGWWMDTDICLLNPLPDTAPEIFIRQRTQAKKDFCVASSLFKAPAHSSVLEPQQVPTIWGVFKGLLSYCRTR